MILVTGGTGLLGANLLRRLVKEGKQPRALYRNMKSVEQNPVLNLIKDQITWIKGDVLDFTSLQKSLQDVTQVYHCAAFVSLDKADAQKMINVNIKGTRSIVDAILETKGIRLLYVSSVAVLSKRENEEFFMEGVPWVDPGKDAGAYNRSKYFAECEVWRGIEEGLHAVIINPSVILGLGPNNISSASIFYKIWKGLPFYSPGSTGFVTAADCVNAMMSLMSSSKVGERYILCSKNLHFKEVFDQIAKNLGKKPPSILPPKWLSLAVCKLAGLQRIFGQSPSITQEAIIAAYRHRKFDGSKITRDTSFTYEPFTEGVKQICTEYKTVLS